MLIVILIIIGIVIYIVTLSANDDQYRKQRNDDIQLNIGLYNIIYECMESAHYLAEDPSSLKKYMVFKRKILTSYNTFEELESYTHSIGFNRYLSRIFEAEYNTYKILGDLTKISNALKQSHDFTEFKNNAEVLSSSFKLLTQGDMTLEDIHKEHQSVEYQLRQRIQN